MKNIVINTSKLIEKTRLDILFKAPIDPEEFVWHNIALTQIDEMIDKINHNIVNGDIVVTDYALHIVIDLFDIPNGNVDKYEKYCIGFIHKYIEKELLEVLNKKEIFPTNVTFWLSNAVTIEEVSLEDYSPNIKEEDRALKSLLGWSDEINNWDEINFKLKCSKSEEQYIDLSKIFEILEYSYFEKNKKSQFEYKKFKNDVLKIISDGKSHFEKSRDDVYAVERITNKTRIVYFVVNRTNEKDILFGFFNMISNIFRWYYSEMFIDNIKFYSMDEVKTLLCNCAKKYEYYSKSESVDTKYNPLDIILQRKESIFEEWNNIWKKEQVSTITNDKTVLKQEKITSIGVDKKFFNLLKEIELNYSSGLIEDENKKTAKTLITQLLDNRKNSNETSFKKIVDNNLKSLNGGRTEMINSERDILDISTLEKERDILIEDITKAEIEFLGNDDIIKQAKEAKEKYADLKRKGKIGIISFFGAVISIIATVFPYVEIRNNIELYNELNWLFILPFCGTVAGIYAVVSGLYSWKILSDKKKIVYELSALKKNSEAARKNSIIAFKDFCEKIVPRAEMNMLLTRELQRRNKENDIVSMKHNNHIKRFKQLHELICDYITMMKISYNEINSGYEKESFTHLDVEQCFYSEENKTAYSIFDFEKELTYVDKSKKENEEG